MRWVAISSAFLLAGCFRMQPYVVPADAPEAATVFTACLNAAAIAMDDGTSDATAIAIGIEGACSTEWERLLSAHAAALNFQAGLIFRRDMASKEIQFATSAVLDQRRLRNGHTVKEPDKQKSSDGSSI